jgi:hypothetical protein
VSRAYEYDAKSPPNATQQHGWTSRPKISGVIVPWIPISDFAEHHLRFILSFRRRIHSGDIDWSKAQLWPGKNDNTTLGILFSHAWDEKIAAGVPWRRAEAGLSNIDCKSGGIGRDTNEAATNVAAIDYLMIHTLFGR